MYPNYYQNNYQNFSQPRSNMEWIMVPSIDQVESVQVQPNSKSWIMVQNEPVFALRTADTMGLVNTEYYRFEKYDASQKPRYVTTAELDEAINRLKGELHESIISTEQ